MVLRAEFLITTVVQNSGAVFTKQIKLRIRLKIRIKIKLVFIKNDELIFGLTFGSNLINITESHLKREIDS